MPDQPFNPAPLAGGTPDYPASLAADGRPGRVTVTCVIQSDGRPQGCRTGLARGGPAFATSALAWLDRGRVRFRVPILHGHAAPGPQSWAVAIEEPPAALAEARRRARAQEDEAASPATPPPPLAQEAPRARQAPEVVPALARQTAPHVASTVNRGFSTRVLGGGAPIYPRSYENEARSGQVLVRCTIEQDGAPAGCAILAQTGGQNFGRAVRDWLGSGRVRFAPILAAGQPVSEVQTWTVTFQPPASQ